MTDATKMEAAVFEAAMAVDDAKQLRAIVAGLHVAITLNGQNTQPNRKLFAGFRLRDDQNGSFSRPQWACRSSSVLDEMRRR